jgi:hypothetical protein
MSFTMQGKLPCGQVTLLARRTRTVDPASLVEDPPLEVIAGAGLPPVPVEPPEVLPLPLVVPPPVEGGAETVT